MILAEGFDARTKNALVAAINKEGATPAIIAPKVGGVKDSDGLSARAKWRSAARPQCCSMRYRFCPVLLATRA